MTTYEILHPTTGSVLYAYPIGSAYPLSAWTTHRILMTEATTKMYYCTVDTSKGFHWAVFEGASQPASYDLALYDDLLGASVAPTVNITPGSISTLHRGDSSNVQLYYNENALVVIPTDLDLTALDIRFVVEDSSKATVLEIPNASIGRTTTTFTVLIPNTVTDTLQDLIWALRMTADDKLLLKGTISIAYAAD